MTRHRGALNAYYAAKEANWLPAVGCQLWTFWKKQTVETVRSSVVVRGVGGGVRVTRRGTEDSGGRGAMRRDPVGVDTCHYASVSTQRMNNTEGEPYALGLTPTSSSNAGC